MQENRFAPAVVLVDGDYLDSVAFDLIVNFERMIGRRIPPADLCHWLDCIALDGGLRPGSNEVQAHFVHAKESNALKHFVPSRYEEDLNGLSFDDRLGRFSLFAFPVEQVVTKDGLFLQSLRMLAAAPDVERLLVVGDMEAYGKALCDVCRQTEGKDVTLFTMEPVTGRGFGQEILGYSLMAALGIRADEL